MFENIPERLSTYVRQTPRELYGSQRELLYLTAANGVVAEYLQKNFFSPSTDPYLAQRKVNEAGGIWFGYPMRIMHIGTTLFRLRSCLGFSEFCRRLKARDLRATFHELLAAKMFLRAGFEIHARAETGIKGQDFDFWATRDGEMISVEVTALTAMRYSLNTILNALHQKRKQLPKDGASIIFCALPEGWDGGGVDLNFATFTAALRFFVTTQRVNAIVFNTERHRSMTADGTKGAFAVIVQPWTNASARIKLKDMNFLFNEDHVPDFSRRAFRPHATISEMPDMVLFSEADEFFAWVDHLVPRD